MTPFPVSTAVSTVVTTINPFKPIAPSALCAPERGRRGFIAGLIVLAGLLLISVFLNVVLWGKLRRLFRWGRRSGAGSLEMLPLLEEGVSYGRQGEGGEDGDQQQQQQQQQQQNQGEGRRRVLVVRRGRTNEAFEGGEESGEEAFL